MKRDKVYADLIEWGRYGSDVIKHKSFDTLEEAFKFIKEKWVKYLDETHEISIHRKLIDL